MYQKISTYGLKVGRLGMETARLFVKKGELYPPKMETLPVFKSTCLSIVNDVKTGAWTNWKLRNVFSAGVVGLETASLFLVGEIIGRQSLIGYK